MLRPLAVPDDSFNEDLAPLQHPGPNLSWQERRGWLRARLEEHPIFGLGEDEMEVHFAGMPPYYWERVTEGDLRWGLETIHGFLQAVARHDASPTTPFLNWRHEPSSNWTRVMLCTWDRHGLLAKCAACFSAAKLDILQANVFTRADNVVLDVFRVWDAGSPSTVSPARLEEMMFLLDGALSDPPRFASVWACSRHKHLASPPRIAHRIKLDNDASADSVVVRVEASDRLGLLYDILQAITESGLNITQARVETDGDVARDTFHVTDAQGRKLLDPGQRERLHQCLDAALTFTQ